MRISLALCAAAVLVGCARGPTPEEAAEAYYGPTPQTPHVLAEQWVRSGLIDPESARFDHWPVSFKTWVRYPSPGEFGWVQCGSVNAKNHFGGYVGRSMYYVVIRDENVVTGWLDDTPPNQIYSAAEVCANRAREAGWQQ